MSRMRGVALVEQCQEHLLEVMRGRPECGPGEAGLRQRDLANAAGFQIIGDRRDTWFTAALLGRLEMTGRIEALTGSAGGSKRFRLRG